MPQQSCSSKPNWVVLGVKSWLLFLQRFLVFIAIAINKKWGTTSPKKSTWSYNSLAAGRLLAWAFNEWRALHTWFAENDKPKYRTLLFSRCTKEADTTQRLSQFFPWLFHWWEDDRTTNTTNIHDCDFINHAAVVTPLGSASSTQLSTASERVVRSWLNES